MTHHHSFHEVGEWYLLVILCMDEKNSPRMPILTKSSPSQVGEWQLVAHLNVDEVAFFTKM
jgi:hypothetical protein